ncbi:uncharacterized sulfatase [Halogranum amylolyticum]|uniref:Uncharacterized sulfatase n=1 Tax=Halogranum amylolyticum TaxID=660520 RepID=A0A1H8WWB7_9EURY|nr:sulfatase [Halogranum amylolyticum]SEP31783.1 uncharacterized sulfatase [Halogranum amylolyticum]
MDSSNVVWLIFDSIRGDRTSLGNDGPDTTPNLERIGEDDDGIATTCFSHAIWSQPSVASMMTGTHPSHHGAGLHNEVIPKQIETVAERCSMANLTTEAVSVNPYFSDSTGADRGFDRFDYFDLKSLVGECSLSSLLSFAANVRKFSGGLTVEKRKHNPDYLLNEIVKDRLENLSQSKEQFFFAAHYHGVHHPYYPAPHYQSNIGINRSDADFAFESSKDVYETIANRCPFSDPEIESIRGAYDALVAQTDALIGDLLFHIDSLGLDENTIVVITSDHGDLLAEYDLFSHKLLLSDELINVPIAVRGSERLSEIELPVFQHIDVMQTVLEEIGVNTDGMQGRLLPEEAPEFAITQRGKETKRQTIEKAREHDPKFDPEIVPPGLSTSIRTKDWKLVSWDEGEVLFEPPNESDDLSPENKEIVSELSQKLSEWTNENGEPVMDETSQDFDDDVRDRLADLGYVAE